MPGEQDFDYDLEEDDTEVFQLHAESGGLDDSVIERITEDDEDNSCYSCSDNGKECDGVECPECCDCVNWCECVRCEECKLLVSDEHPKDACDCNDCDCEPCMTLYDDDGDEDDVNADQSHDLATDSEASATSDLREEESPFKEVVNPPGFTHADNPREAGARSGKLWTHGDVLVVKTMFRAGYGVRAIADAIARTPIAVPYRLYALELLDEVDLDHALASALNRYKRAEDKAKGREPF